MIDDGTLPGAWGSSAFDDEGSATRRTTLIEQGSLVGYLTDRRRAERPTPPANGRRQSFRHLPMVRMTNTFLAPGEDDPDAIVADTAFGVYVADLGGGQADMASGDFVFVATEAYLIVQGRITEPLRGCSLVGSGPEMLLAVDRVGHDLELGGPGSCGKDGQTIPVGFGQPTVRVSALTVGGTAP